MKSLEQIYVEYEIGEIYPENLPTEILNNLSSYNKNEFLNKISRMHKPTRADIHDLKHNAFLISKNKELTKLEKLDLLLNKWLNNKMDSKTLFDRIKYFELENSLKSESFTELMKTLYQHTYGNWIPSDEWDWIMDKLNNNLNIENRYSKYKIKTSC